jgi:hypothetical protein
MTPQNITPQHIKALTHFASAKTLTATGLAKLMQSEKAPAKHAIDQLLNRDLIKSYSPWEYAISEDGRAFLESKGVKFTRPVTRPAKPKRKPATVESAAKKLAERETAGLKGVVTVGVDQQADGLVAGAPQGWASKPYSDMAKDLEGVNFSSASTTAPEPAPLASFDILVRKGLERLNHQLGLKPVEIDRLDLKIETLTRMARLIAPIESAVEDVLLSVVEDLRRISDRSSK